MKYLLDTNTCIYIINRKPPSAVSHIRSRNPDDIAISTVTIAELQYGVNRSQHADRNRIALLEFFVPFNITDFNQSAAAVYGSIRASLEAKGTPIEPRDLLIAAQALSEKLILITNNEKEFRRVDAWMIENWISK